MNESGGLEIRAGVSGREILGLGEWAKYVMSGPS